jgi:hypothetical protein
MAPHARALPRCRKYPVHHEKVSNETYCRDKRDLLQRQTRPTKDLKRPTYPLRGGHAGKSGTALRSRSFRRRHLLSSRSRCCRHDGMLLPASCTCPSSWRCRLPIVLRFAPKCQKRPSIEGKRPGIEGKRLSIEGTRPAYGASFAHPFLRRTILCSCPPSSSARSSSTVYDLPLRRVWRRINASNEEEDTCVI